MAESKLEAEFALQLRSEKSIPTYEREFNFVRQLLGTQDGFKIRSKIHMLTKDSGFPVGDWRFDFAWPEHMIAAEIQGIGRKANGRVDFLGTGAHQTVKGMTRDARKYNYANLLGWDVYLITPPMINDLTGLEMLKQWFLMLEQFEVDYR